MWPLKQNVKNKILEATKEWDALSVLSGAQSFLMSLGHYGDMTETGISHPRELSQAQRHAAFWLDFGAVNFQLKHSGFVRVESLSLNWQNYKNGSMCKVLKIVSASRL